MKFLILGPCAMGAFAILGGLKKIEKELDNLEEIAGSSAGSLIGLFLVLGKSIGEILNILLSVDIPSIVQPELTNVLSSFGLVNHDKMKAFIDFHCEDFSFQELFEKTNKKFHVTAYCVNKSTTDYFSVDSHPQMKVSEALCMSMTVPFIFCAYKFGDFLYLDGGTVEETPGMAFLNKDHEDVMSLQIKSKFVHYEKITSLKTYLEIILNQILNNRLDYDNYKNKKILNLTGVNIFNFSMSENEKITLFLKGHV